MNGYKVLEEAAKLQGIATLDDNLKIIGLPIINAILGEMGFSESTSLSNLIGLPSVSHRRTLISGTAMLIANAVGDTSAARAFSADYNKKLSIIKGETLKVKDVMPKGEWL